MGGEPPNGRATGLCSHISTFLVRIHSHATFSRQKMPMVLGTVRARDSSSPPDDEAGLPWHVILATIAIYSLGRAEWHWLYILPVLWLLKCAEDQRRRRLWNRLYATASAAVASVNTSESVTWLNQIFRAVWQMYERSIGRYALAILQTKVNQNIPKRIGVTAVTLKSFSFGAVEARRSDGRFRIAPVILENVYMVDKRVEPSRDPRKEKIRYLFRSDVRWQTGPSSKLLELAIKHRLVPFDTVDVEVSDLMLEGTLEIEFVFMRSYPWLCHVALSFVQPPSVHFKLSLGASLNALDLMPKLRSWLDDLIESTLTETMVGDNKYTIPLFEWYGEDQDNESPERQASRPSASHPNGPAAGIRARSAPRGRERERERAPPLRPEGPSEGPSPIPPTHAASLAAQAALNGSSGGTGVLRPEAARPAHSAALGHTGIANATSSQRGAAGQAEVADGERRRHRTQCGTGSPPTVGASPQRRSAATKKHAANGCGAGAAAVEVMSESAFFGSDGLDGASGARTVGVPVPGLWRRDSVGVERTPIATYLNDEQTGDVLATWASERPPETPEPYRGIGSTGICSLLGVQPPHSPTNLKVSPCNKDLARASPEDIAAAAAAAQAITPRQPLPRTAAVATPDSAPWSAGIGSAFASAAAAAAAAAGYQMAWHDDRPEWILDPQLLRAARAEEMARGAVGELIVHVTHVVGLVLERPSRLASSLGPLLAASLYVHLAVGDGAEQRGKLLNASAVHAAAGGGTSVTTPSRGADADAINAAEAEGHFVVNHSESCFRLCVHDSLTQKLRMRLCIKEIAVELKELGSSELALAALRVNVPALHAVPLPLAGRQEPAMIHLQVTFRLLT